MLRPKFDFGPRKPLNENINIDPVMQKFYLSKKMRQEKKLKKLKEKYAVLVAQEDLYKTYVKTKT